MTSDPLTHARDVKARHESQLMAYRGVVGVGVGMKQVGGELTQKIAIVVMVRSKQNISEIDPQQRLPSDIEGVPVDVQEAGDVRVIP